MGDQSRRESKAGSRLSSSEAPAMVPSRKLIEAISQEVERSAVEHGPLTSDHLRALAILTEEVGEVADRLLWIDRYARTGRPAQASEAKREAIDELIQVVAVAVQLIGNLDAEEVLRD